MLLPLQLPARVEALRDGPILLVVIIAILLVVIIAILLTVIIAIPLIVIMAILLIVIIAILLIVIIARPRLELVPPRACRGGEAKEAPGCFRLRVVAIGLWRGPPAGCLTAPPAACAARPRACARRGAS